MGAVTLSFEKMAAWNLLPADPDLLRFPLTELTEFRKMILHFFTALFVRLARHGHSAIKKRGALTMASLLLCLGFSILHAEPRKTEKESPVEPSTGYDATLEIYRGETKPITLRAIPSDGYDVEFKILTQPRFGTLSEIVRNSKGSVTILYTHGGDKNQPTDSFKFKIKTGPKKCWATKTTRIQITEPPAIMNISPETLDFGPVFIGESVTLPMLIRNSGGGTLQGRIISAPPWSISGAPDFELPSGKSKTVAITFSPINPDTQLGKIAFETSNKPPMTLHIQGIGEHRFEAPDKAAFAQSIEPSPLRIKIANKTPETLPLTIHANLPLETQDQLTLPPSGTSEIELKIKPGFFTDKFASLQISDGIGERLLKIQLPPPPPALAWETPKLDLGDVTKGTKITLDITLHNRGTTPADFKLCAERDGISIPQPSIHIEPGQSLEIPAYWTPSATGPSTATLRVNGIGNLPPLTFQTNVLEPQTPAPASKILPPPNSSPSPTKTSTANPIHVLTKEENEERKKQTVSNISYRLEQRFMRANAVVTWRYSNTASASFTIEVKNVQRNDNLAKPFEDRLRVPDELPAKKDSPTWSAVPNDLANIHQLPDGSWQGTATNFKPGFHDIRIGAHSSSSNQIYYSSFTINVPPLPSFWMSKWFLISAFLLCAVFLFRRPLLRLFGT